ncbi:MAG: alanine racemase [Planctomycetes bacterium]|nr:alanine racemase [Planctomycetota bacterium]
MDQALQDALRELGNETGSPLRIGGIAARDLVAAHGSPLYVFDADVLRRRVREVRAALGPRVELLWSVKANPSLAVTRCLRDEGTGAEIASLGELHVATAAGHPAAELRFAGPGKTDAEIDAGVAAGLTFHAESADEVGAIAAAADRSGRAARVAVRINLPGELGGSRLRMGGKSSRFGVDEDRVPAVVRTIAGHPSLRLAGLHVYGGTQGFDAAAFVRHASTVVARSAAWEHQLGVAFDELDLGGGFGVAAYAGDPRFDLAAAGHGVQELVHANDRPGRRWFVELGRYLCAPAGVYLATVVRTKDSGGERHVVLDGGLHQHAAAAGFGAILRRPPLLVHTDDPCAIGTTVTVGGPLCTSADQFAEQAALPPLANGDVVAILAAGAYGLTFSPHSFLSHATPAEVMVDAGRARVVRARGTPSDSLRGQAP